jgi:excinuclease ABC subunit A
MLMPGEDEGAGAIRARGVRVHNLKGVDLDLGRDRLVVFSGVSGSGKSSLAFDTLYAEGQRRYIETFSPYMRQFLETFDAPDADLLEGLPPAIAVAQNQGKRSSRSTVGTVTEIHDYLAVLYARLGKVFCLGCGEQVKPADAEDVAKRVEELPEGTRYLITFPMEIRPDSDLAGLADSLREDGFVRVRVGGQVVALGDGPIPEEGRGAGEVDVVVDRLVRGKEDPSRRADSVETAFGRGLGRCRVVADDQEWTFLRGWKCARCGREHTAPEPRLFRYNSAIGACGECKGFGKVIDLDLDRVVPDPSKTLRGGAIAPWTTPAYKEHNDALLSIAPALGIPTDRPFERLEPEQVRMIVEGVPSRGFGGLRGFFDWLEKKTYKMHVRVFLARWRGYRTCPACGGARLRPEALAVKVGGWSIAELSGMAVGRAREELGKVAAGEGARPEARRAIGPVLARLDYLGRIGLDYLSLDRQARTLSGGESRRVALTQALGSGLVNTLYVLDEPSAGLHPRDVDRLIGAIADLRRRGNAVVVVEHDEAILRAADELVDIGPGAGANGGRVLYQGPPGGVGGVAESATGAFLAGRRRVVPPARRRTPSGFVRLKGATGHNLKNVSIDFPMGVLCVVTGVSGSGKSSLVMQTLYPALLRQLRAEHEPGLPFRELLGTLGLDDVVRVDQSPIGRSARSNPATYLKVFDEVRSTFAATHEAKSRGYGPGHFSFNVPGGRCEACEGNGFKLVDMQFLPDVLLRCPECKGTRFRKETLEVTYRGLNIAQVLDLTARESFGFFKNRPKVQARLRPLLDVGLDYLRLGQPASTLSGGEAQRLKLASYLPTTMAALAKAGSADRRRSVFLMDEPTTGLHPSDILTLIEALNALVDIGHSLIVVEHNPEMMLCADRLIDVGPEAGEAGGMIVGEGTPEEVARLGTPTGEALAAALARATG